MARKVRRPLSAGNVVLAPRPVWPVVVVTGLLSALLASAGTYLALRPQLVQSAAAQKLTGDAALSLANAAFDHKDWAGAVNYYTQAIAAGTDTPDLRTDLGTAYRGLKQPQKALEQYAAAQRQDPQHENSLLNTGIVYAYDLNDPAKGAQVWQGYLTRFPHGTHTADVKKLLAQLTALPPAHPSVK